MLVARVTTLVAAAFFGASGSARAEPLDAALVAEGGLALAAISTEDAAEAECDVTGDEPCGGLSFRQLRGDFLARVAANASVHANASKPLGYGKVMTLYHQTSPEAGASILKEGFRLSNRAAICGKAIYFCPTKWETDVKAIGGRGFIIEAQVDLGRIKQVNRHCGYSWDRMNHKKLVSEGYDSIYLDRAGWGECVGVKPCREYIIYDNNRIVSMKGYEHHGKVPTWWKLWHPVRGYR